MKFTRIAALVSLAASSYALCGQECKPGQKPNGALQAPLKLVAVRDNVDAGIQYQIGGNIVINDDCTFTTENFYVFPQPRGARWSCNLTGKDQGIVLSGIGSVGAVNPNTPETRQWSVVEAPDGFCHASLLNDCNDFTLIDEGWQVIARAEAVNPGAKGEKVTNNASSGKKSSNTGDNSGATTSKWGMGLLGLSSLAAYLLA